MIKIHKALLLFALITLPLVLSLVANTLRSHAQNNSVESYKYLDRFSTVFEHIRREFVEEISDKELLEAAIEGLFTVLDPHSGYLNERHYSSLQINTQGYFGGLGMEVTKRNEYILIVAPFDNTPAFRAGLLGGDQIIAIDGVSVRGLSLHEAVNKMRGQEGTDITLKIRRIQNKESKEFTVTLTREIINIPSVRSQRERNDIGYIRITSFSGNTDQQLQQAIEKFKSEKELLGVILDLRNNPGGLLRQAVSVTDMFLEHGEIVSTRGRKEEDSRRYNASEGDMIDGLPLIILINGGSASASEIVAGALQDHKRALIMGTNSFGKGSVQTVTTLSEGKTAIRLTTALYYTPSGRSIQKQGIVPDIFVEQARLEAIPDQRGSESDNPDALESPDQDENSTQAEQTPTSEEQQLDYQLSRAIDLIRSFHLLGQTQQNK